MERRRRSRAGGDRRGRVRARLGALLANKYECLVLTSRRPSRRRAVGTPHATSVIDLSAEGMLVQKLLEPAVDRGSFAIELGIPWQTDDERLWLWTQRVRDLGDRQALRFVGLSEADRTALEELVADVRRRA